jgi:hypothetical protein
MTASGPALALAAAVAVIVPPLTGDRQDEQYHRYMACGYAAKASSFSGRSAS